MKVLLWTTEYRPNIGGIAMMSHALAIQMRRLGHEIKVISNRSDGSLECQAMQISQINVYLFPFERALATGNLGVIKSILGQIEALLDAFIPDIVNLHGWRELFSFYQVRIFQKREFPMCLTVHGLWEQASPEWGKQALSLLAKTKAVNTVSHALMQNLLEICKIQHPSLYVIHNGMLPQRALLQPIPRAKEFLAIGRLVKIKRFEIAFYALQSLIGKHPDIRLTIVGEGELLSSLLSLRDQLGLEGRIQMVGAVPPDRVVDYIDQAKLVLISSSYESFGLVALEAAMRGRPTIASDVGGLREVIEHDATGLLVEPENPAALASAMQQLLDDEEKIEQMGKAALLRAQEKFHIEICAQKYLQMYQEVLCMI